MARQQRIELFGKVTPTGVDQTAGAKYAQVAQLAREVSSTAQGIAEERAIKQGREEGALMEVRGEEGNLKAPELTAGLTLRGQARNAAAITAYKGEVTRDAKLKFQQLFQDHQNEPEVFNAKMQGYLNGLAKGVDPEIMAEIKPVINEYAAATIGKAQALEFAKAQEATRASLTEEAHNLQDDILNAARNGDMDSLELSTRQLEENINAMESAGLINATQKAQQIEKLKEQVFIQSKVGEVNKIISDDTLTPDERQEQVNQVIERIQEKGVDLDPNQKDGLIKSIGALVRQREIQDKEALAEQRKGLAIEISDLKINAATGSQDPAEIEARAFDLFQRDLISESELHSIRASIEKGQQARAGAAETNDKVSRKLAGQEDLVLTQKEVDAYYDANVAPAIEELDATTRGAILANFVNATKVVPKGLKQRVNQFAMSSNPDLVLEASATMEGIEKIPGLSDAFSSQSRVFLTKVARLSSVIEPEEALRIARENTDPRRAGSVERAETVIKEFEKSKPDFYSEKSSDFVPLGRGLDAITAGSLEKEYKLIFQEHIKLGADVEEAEEIADRLISRNWGESPSMGRFMKHPPENFYSVAGSDNKYIVRQLSREVNDLLLTKESIKNEDIILISDVKTEKEASLGTPTYLVQVKGSDGTIRPVIGEKGGIMRFMPDKMAEIKRIKKKHEDMAKGLREQAASQKLPSFVTDKDSGLL